MRSLLVVKERNKDEVQWMSLALVDDEGHLALKSLLNTSHEMYFPPSLFLHCHHFCLRGTRWECVNTRVEMGTG